MQRAHKPFLHISELCSGHSWNWTHLLVVSSWSSKCPLQLRWTSCHGYSVAITEAWTPGLSYAYKLAYKHKATVTDCHPVMYSISTWVLFWILRLCYEIVKFSQLAWDYSLVPLSQAWERGWPGTYTHKPSWYWNETITLQVHCATLMFMCVHVCRLGSNDISLCTWSSAGQCYQQCVCHDNIQSVSWYQNCKYWQYVNKCAKH